MEIASCFLMFALSVGLDFVEAVSSSDSDTSQRSPPQHPLALTRDYSSAKEVKTLLHGMISNSDTETSSRSPHQDPLAKKVSSASPSKRKKLLSETVQLSDTKDQSRLFQQHTQASSSRTSWRPTEKSVLKNRPRSSKEQSSKQAEGPLRVVRMKERDLPRVWTNYGVEHGFSSITRMPVQDYLDVIVKGDTIIGRAVNHEYYPIYTLDQRGWHHITMKFGHPAHSPKIYNLTYEMNMFHPLPDDTIYEPPLRWPRSPSPPRNLYLRTQQ